MGARAACYKVETDPDVLLRVVGVRGRVLGGVMLKGERGGVLVYLVAAAAALGVLAALVFWADRNIATSAGVKKGEAAVQKKWDAANKDAREREAAAGTTAATGLEVDRGKAKIIYRTITKEVDKIVLRDVYRNICFDDDGLRAANTALIGALTSAAKPDRAVPKPLAP